MATDIDTKKLRVAIEWIGKLANGVNPIDGSALPENDIVNNIHISRCLFYVSNLFKIIQKESESRPELIAESYEILSMVYDSGRLEYLDIVEYTRQLRDTYNAT